MNEANLIFFPCHECGEEMEISRRQAGREVQCVSCGKYVEVPMSSQRFVARTERNAGLTANEWLLFSLLFFLIPAANVFVSSILYYIWKTNHPRRAGQINLLGFLIFGLHFIMLGGFFVLLAWLSSPR